MIRIENVNGQYIIYIGNKLLAVAKNLKEAIKIAEENNL